MLSKYLYGLSAFVLAFAILSVSVLRSADVTPAYAYSSPLPSTEGTPTPRPDINYNLPYPGKISPDNSLWYLKALRDRVQFMVTQNQLKKAELALLYADKRLGASVQLFQNKKPDMGVSVLTKGEKYLEMALIYEGKARDSGVDTDEFLKKAALGALKHREIIFEEIIPLTPEDLRPEVIKAGDYSQNTYKYCRDMLNGHGKESPKDPFNGE